MTSPPVHRGGARELAVVLVAGALLATALTYPLAFKIGHAGRVDNGDGQLSIWNVAWVARTIVVDPLHVFDANIFYPHRGTLAFSENNMGAGLLAIPAYWLTRNPVFAHNVVVLVAFTLSATGMYYLVRYLVRDRRAAAISAVCFAFCPYVFARLPHIQLLMTAGLPFSMLAFHRFADRPTARRGAVLGVVMAAQAICCGYYGIFVLLMVGFAALFLAATRRRWTNRRYWMSLAVGAAIAVALVGPLFLPYAALQRNDGILRTMDESLRYSANWSSYFVSSAYAHSWMQEALPPWNEVLFPGIIASALGVGAWIARREADRETTALYGSIALLALWASFGPRAGLYAVLYKTVPLFTWMRAPGRFGLMVAFALAVLAGVAAARLLSRARHAGLVTAGFVLAAVAELVTPVRFDEVSPISPAYQILATQPAAPVIEMPFFEQRNYFPRHALYMMNSTVHWMPLVNGYSDTIPDDFRDNAVKLAPFPYLVSFHVLERLGVRYAVFHMKMYDAKTRAEVEGRLTEFSQYLQPLYIDDETRLYEIVGFPP
jgi:hypothetical protein